MYTWTERDVCTDSIPELTDELLFRIYESKARNAMNKVYLLMCERWGGQHYYTEVVAAYNSKEKAQEEAKASQGGVPKSDLTYFVEEVDWAD